jgi:hypothetical protein
MAGRFRAGWPILDSTGHVLDSTGQDGRVCVQFYHAPSTPESPTLVMPATPRDHPAPARVRRDRPRCGTLHVPIGLWNRLRRGVALSSRGGGAWSAVF